MQQRKDMFVLNDFLKFERKLYQFAGFKVGRPLKLKSIGYFFAITAIIVVWYYIPVLNIPLKIIPNSILIAAPFMCTYLLVDVGTENRPPVKFLKSMFLYHIRKSKRVTYFKGMELDRPKSYGFGGQLSAREYRQQKKKKKRTHYQFEGYMTMRD
ncbi:TcpE family conjugal transfer membrane protein [Paenibacillus sp. OK076]|uniref:TcpE family conjugal transfer membrane protein n=1 Tax=Paenibacillus sp. OK076 TaxID=1884379 RepID=UPI0008CF673E|nr:TcpE family conjugal transfer membrane protein [Paenibacillus sp. OK076]SEP33361.1 TcpE family protein [Paenibacillus sp. OK076]